MTNKTVGELLVARIESRGKAHELKGATREALDRYEPAEGVETPLFWQMYAYKKIGIAVTVDHDGRVEVSTSRARSKSTPRDMDKALRMLGFNPRALPTPVPTEQGRMYLVLQYEHKR